MRRGWSRTIDVVEKGTLEDQLMSNQLSYPSNFDGKKWKSTDSTRRKSLPSYLREDLPKKRFRSIKDKFQEMNMFSPPEITYFEGMIKRDFKATGARRPKQLQGMRKHFRAKKQQEPQEELKTIKQGFTYSLMTTNPKSQVLMDILEQSEAKMSKITRQSSTERDSFERRLVSSQKDRNSHRGKPMNRCFKDTMDIVFSLKKRQMTQILNRKKEPQIPQGCANYVNSIHLFNMDTEE